MVWHIGVWVYPHRTVSKPFGSERAMVTTIFKGERMIREELEKRVLDLVDDIMKKGKREYRYKHQLARERQALAERIMDLIDEWQNPQETK